MSEAAQKEPSILHWSPGQIIRTSLAVLGVFLAFFLLFRFRLVVFSLFEAIVFSTALTPLVEWLQRRRIPRPIAIILLFSLILLLVTGFLLLVVPIISEQGATISSTISGYYRDLRSAMLESPSLLLQRIAWRMPFSLLPFSVEPVENTDPTLDPVSQVLGIGNAIFRALFTSIAVLLLTFYWTLDRERILRWLVLLLPTDRREDARSFISEMEEKIGAYIRGLAVLCLVVGVLALIAYIAIGLPNALLLGIIAGLMEAVPLIGPFLGAIPALVMALAIDPSKVVWIIAATIVIQLLENNLLVPRIMDRAVGVNPVVGLLAFAAFSSLFGLAGALLAIPLAVVVQLVIRRLVLHTNPINQPVPAGRDYLSLLRYEAQELVQDVRKQVRDKEGLIDDESDQVEDAIEAIVNDLDSILASAEKDQLEAQQ